MKKDAYYFPHDSNAKDDPKCMLLIDQLGLEGYGIFWVLVELLRDQPGYKYSLELIPAIAKRYNTTTEKVKAVISKYDLFAMEDNMFFFSESLRNRMMPLDTKRQKLSEAGIRGNLKRWGGESGGDGVVIAIREEESRREKSKEEKNIRAFDIFWNLYDKKVDKKNCQVKWNNLTKKDQESIIDNLPKYLEATPDVQFRKDPKSYIYNRSWENEYLSKEDEEKTRLDNLKKRLKDERLAAK